jgi:hypothetical protein
VTAAAKPPQVFQLPLLGLLQVKEGPACARNAMSVVSLLCLPFGKAADPLWQRPFNAAALLVPSVLDSCLILMEKLSTSSGSSDAGSSSGSRRSTTAEFGKGSCTVSSQFLVCPWFQGASLASGVTTLTLTLTLILTLSPQWSSQLSQ